jgi:hypothetical protein
MPGVESPKMKAVQRLKGLASRLTGWRTKRRAGYVDHEYWTAHTLPGDQHNAGVGGTKRH